MFLIEIIYILIKCRNVSVPYLLQVETISKFCLFDDWLTQSVALKMHIW